MPRKKGRRISASEVRRILADGVWRCRSQICELAGETGRDPVLGPTLQDLCNAGDLVRQKRRHPEKQMRVWFYRLSANRRRNPL